MGLLRRLKVFLGGRGIQDTRTAEKRQERAYKRKYRRSRRSGKRSNNLIEAVKERGQTRQVNCFQNATARVCVSSIAKGTLKFKSTVIVSLRLVINAVKNLVVVTEGTLGDFKSCLRVPYTSV